MITFSQKGDFSKTYSFLKKAQKLDISGLEAYGKRGVEALSDATPKDTGLTASSWSYAITNDGKTVTISFSNSNVQNGILIAVILRYGHATGNGGWIEGYDYISPAIQPIFDEIVDHAWKEVKRL